MQQTPLDRWLRRKFVYITRVYCNTLPADLPPELTVEEAPEESGGRFLYKLSTTSDDVLRGVVEEMKKQNVTYTSRIEDKKVWYARFLNNPHKSFTFRCVWVGLAVSALILAFSGLPQKLLAYLLDEDEVVEEIVDAPGSDDVKVFHKRDKMVEIDRVK